MTDLRKSPLHGRHLALDPNLAEFGGWLMPLQYAQGNGGGVVPEHVAVREVVGVFDVSHLGKLSISGSGTTEFVNSCFTADLDRIKVGQAQYTMCCADDGGVVDDLIVYRSDTDELLAVPNAANAAEVARLLEAAAPPEITIRNLHTDLAVIAVQGPRSAEVLASIGLDTGTPGADELGYMSFLDFETVLGPVRVCRTGYTGERGYELILGAEEASALWDELVAEAVSLDGRPCGLGARDTLRTEMGYALHGQDLSPEITPVQARCGWAVGWRKPAFWGREALLAEREAGPARQLWGLRVTGRGVLRPGMPVLAGGNRVGVTTSGTFSPTLRTGIALALVDSAAGLADGGQAQVDVRGRSLECDVVDPPFVPSHVR